MPKKKRLVNEVFLGDALDLLSQVEDNSVDAVIADPPYNIGKDFGNNHDNLELGEYLVWCDKWIAECFRVLKPQGTMFIYGFSEILAHVSVRIEHPQRWLIWHYTNKNVASATFWQRSHEAILATWKFKPLFNRDAVREPYTDGFLKGAAGKVRAGTAGRFSKGGEPTVYQAHEKGALPRDVLRVPALAGGAGMKERWFLCNDCDAVFPPTETELHRQHQMLKHPTQKPLELTRRLLLSCMPETDGIVLIPFAGSGSECLVARTLSHSFLAAELNPQFARLASAVADSATT